MVEYKDKERIADKGTITTMMSKQLLE
jgi:hypothetical protein